MITFLSIFVGLSCLMSTLPTLTLMLERSHKLPLQFSYYFFAIQEVGFTLASAFPLAFSSDIDR
jgi:hypothetical protein